MGFEIFAPKKLSESWHFVIYHQVKEMMNRDLSSTRYASLLASSSQALLGDHPSRRHKGQGHSYKTAAGKMLLPSRLSSVPISDLQTAAVRRP